MTDVPDRGGDVLDDGIFLEAGGELIVLEQHDYATEDVLQRVLATHPGVLAGSSTAGGAARLLLIGREVRIPVEEDGSGNLRIDHLFLDAQGVPVLVEVKRASDTRTRREVVAQMLDYAANAVKHLPLQWLHDRLEETAAHGEEDIDDLLARLSPEQSAEELWRDVEANLRAGRIRMLIVADRLPDSLVRIIEFLNEQMNPAEVLGVELRRYAGGEHTVYVPRVLGRTAAAESAKTRAPLEGQQWDRESFLAAAQERCTPAEVALVHRLLDEAESHGSRVAWGKGATPRLNAWYAFGEQQARVWVLNVNTGKSSTRPWLKFHFDALSSRLSAEQVERTASLLEGVPVLAERIRDARRRNWQAEPAVHLPEVVGDAAAVDAIFRALDALRVADGGIPSPTSGA
ncbi:hypothetical protein Krad_4409 [Kineococcus radiotolerans SRS30216 = ATCC BAA-149]|uniref:DUF91 domain-containing protein n=1 Tax=Kineococcus radiotolerans (strain ATCC BAA-149 / DSM 14245 / SRS30216) TaxID=266940 RepID=A6WGC9_KINRD|nr:hypothetical protein Krad_4409 [Kineococcus radiotolerans SRS30216 = ATCC BAA-149]